MLKKFFQKAKPASSEQFPDVSGLLEKHYINKVTENNIKHDYAQLAALQHLQKLLDNMLTNMDYQNKPPSYKLLANAPGQQGVYIFGDVGRGKSMLMDLFYEACPIPQKRRVHFNTFMLEVHAFIHDWHKRSNKATDAISALAKKTRDSVFLLCFDEFHVTDIADAMILGRLFSKLFESGIIVVITSNRHPSDLYQGGLQREQFLFFIKVLQGATKIIELVAKEDYRLGFRPTAQSTYYFPLDGQAKDFVQQRYRQLTDDAVWESGVLEVFGRNVFLSAVYRDIALSSFDELCAQALGSADYLKIASEFSLLIITDIPKLTAEKRNEAKRFVTLIDALYEHKVKLICSAEVPAQELYTEGDGAFEFRRTVSRLIEMQSESYLQSRHIKYS